MTRRQQRRRKHLMARILVPLDGSRLAEKALCCAIALGTELQAKLVLFRAVSVPSDVRKALDRAGLETGVLIEHLEIEAVDYLKSVTQRLL
jgi:nucleotide-binding universal stress UspA family protein